MATPLVLVDFNCGGRFGPNLEYGVVWLLAPGGTWKDLERQHIELKEGMELRMYDCDLDDNGKHDDLIAEGVVHWDNEHGCWSAVFPWNEGYHVSDVRNNPSHWANEVDWPAVHRAIGMTMGP